VFYGKLNKLGEEMVRHRLWYRRWLWYRRRLWYRRWLWYRRRLWSSKTKTSNV